MDDIIIALYAIVQARYVDIDCLNRWAVSIKCKLPGDHYWLHALEYCQHMDCAETALEQELGKLRIDVGKILPRLVVGFLYLRFRKQELTLHELEIEIVDVGDGSDLIDMDIEYVRMNLPALASNMVFQSLFNRLANESLNHLHKVDAMTL